MDKFIHLQCYSEYSFLDGSFNINDFIKDIKKKNIKTIALTDKHNFFSMVKFYYAAVKANIKPIIGCTVFIKVSNIQQLMPVILLCKNYIGYKNISSLISCSYINISDKYDPYIYMYELEIYNHGIIAIAASINSDIAYCIINNKKKIALKLLLRWMHIFKNNFYLGITRLGKKNENKYIKQILPIALKFGCPIVAINEVCFLNKIDFEFHRIKTSICEKQLMENPVIITGRNKNQYLKQDKDIIVLFDDIPGSILNSLEISKRCNIIFNINYLSLPKFYNTGIDCIKKFFFNQIINGLKNYIKNDTSKYIVISDYMERLAKEFNAICYMGFPNYFLLVSDYIGLSDNKNILIGSGRGSGAGSLIAYYLGITNINPLQYSLLFERFLNTKRESVPDFDIDFCAHKREDIVKYMFRSIRPWRISQIITYATMNARGVIRDVGRILKYRYNLVDKIVRFIPMTPGVDLTGDEISYKFDKFKILNNQVGKLLGFSNRLEALVKNIGVHAGGMIISQLNITKFMPVSLVEDEEELVSHFGKMENYKTGFSKFDFLGLKTLTIIQQSLEFIYKLNPIINNNECNIYELKQNDKNTYNMILSGATHGIFQLESKGMKNLIKQVVPDNFTDVIALMALFRPGPLKSGIVKSFIYNKFHLNQVQYLHPFIKSVLKDTYGIIIYQEQVMQISQKIAGYNLEYADLLRISMCKKEENEMRIQKTNFIDSSVKNNFDRNLAGDVFEFINKFAGYGFNKSHSVSYAILTYQTSWLKANYGQCFFSSLLTTSMADIKKLNEIISECLLCNFIIVSPNINESQSGFAPEQNNNKNILWGLMAIKNVNSDVITDILIERKINGPYTNIFNLYCRINLNIIIKNTISALIQSGAMNEFQVNDKSIFYNFKYYIKIIKIMKNNFNSVQNSLFNITNHEIIKKCKFDKNFILYFNKNTLIKNENNMLGRHIKYHPLNQYADILRQYTNLEIYNLEFKTHGYYVIGCIIERIKILFNNEKECSVMLTISDITGKINLTLSTQIYERYKNMLKEKAIIIISLFISYKKKKSVFCQKIKLLSK